MTLRVSAPPVNIFAMAVGLLVAALVSSGCGYALAGRGSFLPDYIRVVGVPAFENKSQTPEIDRVLTDAVRTEFAGRGRYTIKPEAADVDAILSGAITDVRFDAAAFTQASQASRLAVIVTASFEFRDVRTNKVLWSQASLQYREYYDVSTTTAGNDVTAFFGQNTTALQRLAQSFSQSVVTSILEAF